MNESDPVQHVVENAWASGLLAEWHASNDDPLWSQYRPSGHYTPDVGVKVHVSAVGRSAPTVLARALPVLVSMRVPFKHAASLDSLAHLNSGAGGLTQVGKFLTAYPSDDDAVGALASKLDEVTTGLPGPRLMSEAPIRAGSLVHLRYGSFSKRWLQLRTGRIVPARRTADGALELDDRTDRGDPGKLISALGRAPLVPEDEERLLRGRYMRVEQLHASLKGSTWLGYDTEDLEQRLLIIKEAYAHVMEDTDGVDAIQRLASEADCLRALGSTGVVPTFVEYWRDQNRAVLLYEAVEGPTLASLLSTLAAKGLRPPEPLTKQWVTSLCDAVERIHRREYVVGDIKPANLVLVDGQVKLIDLELAGRISARPKGGLGTYGYASPEQYDSCRPRTVCDDVYAIGATLVAISTATDASTLPAPRDVAAIEARRNPRSAPLYQVARDCLERDACARPPTAAAVKAAVLEASPGTARDGMQPNATAADFERAARDIGDALLASAERDDDGLYWRSSHPIVQGQVGRDLYAGSAGTAVFLTTLYGASSAEPYLDAALRCARWLESGRSAVPTEDPMQGLYFGTCGVGVLYLHLAGATGNPAWLEKAISVGDRVDHRTLRCPDLLTGAAGVGLYHVMLWSAGGPSACLDRALEIVSWLEARKNGPRPTWTIPEGFESLSGQEFLGFAHGSAGVGYFLAECALASGEPEPRIACAEIADWLIGEASPSLGDMTGLAWPATRAGPVREPTWCHGAPGIARFLLKAYEATGTEPYRSAAVAAGRTIFGGTRWHGTTQCHGLAGNIDILVDLAATDDSCMSEARELGENLLAYRTEVGWPSEAPGNVTPDLMVGQAGLGLTFLRLVHARLPHPVSCDAVEARDPRRATRETGASDAKLRTREVRTSG